MLSEALRLSEMGFAVQWLRPQSKAPVNDGWNTVPIMSVDLVRATYRCGFNVGFRPGKLSVMNGREVCVLDIDVRGGAAYAEEAYAAAKSLMGAAYQPTVVSGSLIGRHQFVGFPIGQSPEKAATTLRQSDVWLRDGRLARPGDQGARPAWTVELLSTGKNVVLPPSIHPDTLRPYAWAEGRTL